MGSPDAEPSLAIIQSELREREGGFPSEAYAAYIGALLDPVNVRLIELIGLRHIPGLVQSPSTSSEMARHAKRVVPERSEQLRTALIDHWQTIGWIPVDVFLSTKISIAEGQAQHLLDLADRGLVTLVQFFRPTPAQMSAWGNLTVISEVYPEAGHQTSLAYVEYNEQSRSQASDEGYTPNMPSFGTIAMIAEAARFDPMTRDASTERLEAIARGERVP